MSTVAFLIAAFAVASAACLVAWVEFAMASANDDLRSFVDFERLRFYE